MLTGEAIKKAGIIEDGDEASYRATTYDLRVGIIIKPDGETCTTCSIPPQGIVEIVSKERIKLDKNVSGFATVKTSMSNQGLLALNIGIIDPEYEGPISTFLLNFSKNDLVIGEGESFIRTHFVDIVEPGLSSKSVIISSSDYILSKRKKVRSAFGDTFLNIDLVVREVANQYAVKILAFVGVLALIVTTCSFLSNFATVQLLRSWIDPRTSIQKDVETEMTSALVARRREIAALRAEIQRLRACVEVTKRGNSQAALPVGACR